MRVRPIDSTELPALVGVVRACDPDDRVGPAEFEDWRRQADDTVWLLAEEDGCVVGSAVGVHGWHSPPGRLLVEIRTAPDARRRGAGTALLAALTSWAAELGATEIVGEVGDDDPKSLAWATRRGFVEVGRSKRVALDLDAVESPPVAPPPGIEIASWSDRPGIEAGLYAVYCEAEPDIPGEEHNEIASLDRWLADDMQGVADRADAVFVAFAGDEVIGYAKLSFGSDPTDRTGYHDLTGVRRAWRGRGVAGALKRAQIAWAKQHGLDRLVTANEERNAPIRALNARYGYRPVPGKILLRAPLPQELESG